MWHLGSFICVACCGCCSRALSGASSCLSAFFLTRRKTTRNYGSDSNKMSRCPFDHLFHLSRRWYRKKEKPPTRAAEVPHTSQQRRGSRARPRAGWVLWVTGGAADGAAPVIKHLHTCNWKISFWKNKTNKKKDLHARSVMPSMPRTGENMAN